MKERRIGTGSLTTMHNMAFVLRAVKIEHSREPFHSRLGPSSLLMG